LGPEKREQLRKLKIGSKKDWVAWMEPFQARQSYSHAFTVDEICRRLERQPEVDGILMMGSGAGGELSLSSDIDLLVILRGEPLPLFMLSTTIQARLAEVYFARAEDLDHFLAQRQPVPDNSYSATLLRWIMTGQIFYDPSGRLGALRAVLAESEHSGHPKRSEWFLLPAHGELYNAWYSTNYDLVQTRRLLESQDPIVQMKVDLRLIFMIDQLWTRYFVVRRLPGMSHKASIRWMAENAPEFYARLQAFLVEPDRTRKFEHFQALAMLALEPVGGLWPEMMTAVQLAGNADPGLVENQLDIWARWMA
jgi:predicted nucleotidyltransferase